jgi:hypothetical protein
MIFFILSLLGITGPVAAQTVIYSGREYLQQGRSWFHIREVDLATGRHTQLTTDPHNHSNPWCGPDKKSILFTPGTFGHQKSLFHFDRVTKKETFVVLLEQDLFAIVGALDDSRIVVQEYGGVIEIVDIAAGQKVRRISGVNPTIAPNRKVMAWQTAVDTISNPDQKRHILLSDIDGSNSVDLGEGTAPFFMLDGTQLLFARSNKATDQVDIVHYKIKSRVQEVQPTGGIQMPTQEYDLTASLDGSTIVLSTDGGRYGTAVFWRMTSSGEWSIVDENLHPWGGWSGDGRLIYATDGRDLRPLDAQRNVWVSDIKLLDQHSGQTSTVVSGVSMNQDPCWCDSGK